MAHYFPSWSPDRPLTEPPAPAITSMPWRRAGLTDVSGTAAVAAIGVYQRYVSPHKGFCCAWRVHTGRPSCSAWGRRVMGRFGCVVGWALLMRQFRRCQAAAVALRAPSLAMASAPHDEDTRGEKPNDPVVNEACPLWSKRADAWCWNGRATKSVECCVLPLACM